MIRPVDLQDDDLFHLFEACRAGDLHGVTALVTRRRELIQAQYDYTPPLHFAVREGHLPIVRLLLDRGADHRTEVHQFRDSLLTMAMDREHQELAAFLRELAARQFPLQDGLSSFLEAARKGDLAAIARSPALARASTDTGDTALHQAAGAGHVAVLTALLDAGASVDAARADGRRPVHCALENGHGEALALLFGRGGQYNIYFAAALGDGDYVRKALARNSALANFAEAQHRPISAAAWRKDLDMVKLLLAHGANPSLPEEGAPLGQALWTAVYQNQPEMVRVLLEHGANPNTAPESSGSALGHARKNPELRKLLLDHGAQEDTSALKELETLISDDDLAGVETRLAKDPGLIRDPLAFWGEGILAVPANRGSRAMIELLLRYGARVPDVVKWGPQYYLNHADIGVLLLERGMSPNQMNWQRFTLLHRFAAEGDLAKMRLLLDHGAEINAIDEEYCSTPLGCAARWGRHEAVKLLRERGADTQRAGARWAKPLAWARKKGHTAIAQDLTFN